MGIRWSCCSSRERRSPLAPGAGSIGPAQGFDHSAISIANTEASLAFTAMAWALPLKAKGLIQASSKTAWMACSKPGLPSARSAPALVPWALNSSTTSPPGDVTVSSPCGVIAARRKLLLKSSNLRAIHQQLLADQARNHCSALVALDPALLGSPMAFTVRDPDGGS